jgi:hypothetical protein
VDRLLEARCSSRDEWGSLAHQGHFFYGFCSVVAHSLFYGPSDLLPLELGDCDYEKGTDGKLFTVLTDPTVLSFDLIQEEWDVDCLLNQIAHKPYGTSSPISLSPLSKHAVSGSHYNALIDTGALITGLSNFEVAQYLLDNGLKWCEGVVFLDDDDKKVLLWNA